MRDNGEMTEQWEIDQRRNKYGEEERWEQEKDWLERWRQEDEGSGERGELGWMQAAGEVMAGKLGHVNVGKGTFMAPTLIFPVIPSGCHPAAGILV